MTELQETYLRGPNGRGECLKVGGKFCWITPDFQDTRTGEAAARRMIKELGEGPFVATKIERRGNGSTGLTFTDGNGKEQTIVSDYFCVYPE
jgi:hypothetical protein